MLVHSERQALACTCANLHPPITLHRPPTDPHPTTSFTDGAVYAGRVSGSLDLRFFDHNPSARIGGYFTFNATNLRDTVDVSGAFDFEAPASNWYCQPQ